MNKYFLVIVFILAAHTLFSQNRYFDPVFSSVSTIDVIYGNNDTYNNQNKNLKMKIFQPNGDNATSRKCLLWMHGGGFQGGSYEDSQQTYLCEYFALRGYVTASVQYRLGISDPTNCLEGFEAEYRAAQDYKAAVRYMKKNASKWNIDTSQIFVGGSSAGGITALHCAYWDIEEVPLQMISKLGDFNASGNSGYSDKVAGVASWASAIEDTAWLKNEITPFLAIHDSWDPTVDYIAEQICDVENDYLFGDSLVKTYLSKQNTYTDLVTYYDSIHVPQIGDSPLYYEWIDTTRHQLYRLIQSGVSFIPHQELSSDSIQVYYYNSALRIYTNHTKWQQKIITVEIVDMSGRKVSSHRIQGLSDIYLPSTAKGLFLVVLYIPEENFTYHKKIAVL